MNFLTLNIFSQTDDCIISVSVNKKRQPKHDQICDEEKNEKLASEERIRILNNNRLEESLCYLNQCYWFYGDMSHSEALVRLSATEVGSFLIRKSAHPDSKYCFSLSMKTNTDTVKSMRFTLQEGLFYATPVSKRFQKFSNVFELILFLRESCTTTTMEKKGQPQIFSGLLLYPIWHSPPSLTHLCRLAINRTNLEYYHFLLEQLPRGIKDYLKSYPFTI